MFRHFENVAIWFRAANTTGDRILIELNTGKTIGTVMRRRDGAGWLARSYIGLPSLCAALWAGSLRWDGCLGLELTRRGIAIVDWGDNVQAMAQIVEIRATFEGRFS